MPYNIETETNIQLAIEDIEAGNVSSKAEAVQKHKIPEASLRRRMKGGKSLVERPIQGQILTDEQDLGLCLHIDHMDNIFFPLHQANIEACANAILAQSQKDPTSIPESVGSKWTLRLLLRHPEYKKRIQEVLDIHHMKA
jgi:hypothetical protein